MSFVGKPDPVHSKHSEKEPADFGDEVAIAEMRRAAEDELNAFLEYAPVPVVQSDTKLSTDEFESILQAKLRATRREAVLANDELGINTLFLTLGTLEWRESPERSHRAPLLYIPVTIRETANGSIRILHDGSDVGINLPLIAKLTEFNIRLPELNEDKSILDYFEEVESTIRNRSDWIVHRDEICLGFFNYEKYAMYMDLGGDTWPSDRKPWIHEDLVSMLGERFPEAKSDITAESFIDDYRPVGECHEVYSADSSQTLAMIRAASGISMVIEGPPGTGKSQTITNIISEAVAAKKTVLFVSAKRAALDVVKRRLAEVDLGDMCLDLHDKLTNRREFYSEIKRTAALRIHVPEQDERVKRLTELRDQLNRHCQAVNEQEAAFEVAPFTAMSILASLPKESVEDREGRMSFDSLSRFRHPEIPSLVQTLKVLEERIRESGIPCENAFWGAGITIADPATKLDLEQELSEAEAALRKGMEQVKSTAKLLRIPSPTTAQQVEILRTCAKRALEAPSLDGIAIKTDAWEQHESLIKEGISKLQERQKIRERRSGEIKPDAWEQLPSDLLPRLEAHAPKWYRVLVGDYRSARKSLQTWLTPSGPTGVEAQLDLLRELKIVREIEAFFQAKDSMFAGLFGVQWQGLESQPAVLNQISEWVFLLYQDIEQGEVPEGLLDFLAGSTTDPNLLAKVEETERFVSEAIQAYQKAASTLSYSSATAVSEELETLLKRVQRWSTSLPALNPYINLMEARRKALEKGLDVAVEVADVWDKAFSKLADSFTRSYYTGVTRKAMEERPELRTFERVAHESAIQEFRTLDEFMLRYNRAKVRLAHFQNIPRFETAVGNLLQLRLQCELQRSHKPIRWIMARSGEAIQRIKPVFMMSPLSVAIHLPPEMPPFDLVIFDEASQVKPEDALSAIIRAKQTIVVGDTRQMPPTSFFDRIADESEEEEEDDATELGREAAKLESILSLMSVAAEGEVRRPDLKWHYRSLHPSLIQPSNELFYENRLVVFPSPGVEAKGRRIGVVFHHHPETVYEGGDRKRINRREAELVAQAVLRHITEQPDQSLMVAAMNRAQADLIYVEVQKLERLHPDAFQAYAARFPHERLDVKNLENVQGDERDVVYISITYGRDANGVIRQQFGPILRDGGERRLNVLITRARQRCEVFSNITAEDLRVESGQRGLTALKHYLAYAQRGSANLALEIQSEATTPFDQEISSLLTKLGYVVDTQVGTEGCRIDLAVVKPDKPGEYLLGIECDGSSYNRSRSARDRDKLRSSVLESRGWHLHRIWSTDWWQNKDQEIDRLLQALEKAKDEAPKPTFVQTENDLEPLVEEAIEALPIGRIAQAYDQTPSASLASEDDLANYLIQIIQHEGPISHDLLILRLRNAAGYAKTNLSLRTWFDSLITQALATQGVQEQEGSYYLGESQLRRVRDWSDRPNSERRIDLVSHLEIAAALIQIVEGAFGISEEEAVKQALALVGFKRATTESRSRVSEIVQSLLNEGKIRTEAGNIFPVR